MLVIQLIFFFQLARKELDGFEQLFGRYLQETGPSVIWDKIKNSDDQQFHQFQQNEQSIMITIHVFGLLYAMKS
jgi:hypothetical protein